MKYETLEKRQREMRERTQHESAANKVSQPDTTQDIADILKKIRDLPAKTHGEYMNVLSLINTLEEHLDPTETFSLQMELTLKHYNANKRLDEPGAESIVSALIQRLARTKET